MKLRLAIFLCFTLGLWTCKKDLGSPEPSPDPVFMVGYQIDGTSYSLTAGLQTTYLFTRAELGQDNVWQLSGSFADAGCPEADCPGSLSFYWRNNSTGNNFDSTWTTREFPFYFPDPGVFTYENNLSLNTGSGVPAEIIWTINDSLILLGKEQTYLNDGAPVRIVTEVIDTSGYRVRSEQFFLPGENSFCARCSLNVDIDSMVTLDVIPLGPGNYTFKWKSGDTTKTIQAPYVSNETYAVTVTNTTSGCTATIAIDHLPSAFGTIKSGHPDAVSTPIDGQFAGGPIIEWIDPQGVVWRSDRAGQQPFPANHFQIIEIEDYLNNENGLPTKKLRVAWNGVLYNEKGEARKMSGEGVVAMGWPE